MDIEKFITVREACKLLNVNKARVAVLCREGRFKGARKLNLGWIIPRAAVENFTRLSPGAKPKNEKRTHDSKLIATTLATLQEQEAINNDEQR